MTNGENDIGPTLREFMDNMSLTDRISNLSSQRKEDPRTAVAQKSIDGLNEVGFQYAKSHAIKGAENFENYNAYMAANNADGSPASPENLRSRTEAVNAGLNLANIEADRTSGNVFAGHAKHIVGKVEDSKLLGMLEDREFAGAIQSKFNEKQIGTLAAYSEYRAVEEFSGKVKGGKELNRDEEKMFMGYAVRGAIGAQEEKAKSNKALTSEDREIYKQMAAAGIQDGTVSREDLIKYAESGIKKDLDERKAKYDSKAKETGTVEKMTRDVIVGLASADATARDSAVFRMARDRVYDALKSAA